MRAQTYRPRIQNGPVAKRRTRAAAEKVSDRSVRSRRSSRNKRRQSYEWHEGSRVLWVLIFIGALVAAGFIYALRSQISAHQLGQAEAQLKAELEEIANRQRYEIHEQQRALSPREADRAARQAGLIQPRLNQPNLKINQKTISSHQSEQTPKGKKESGHQRQSTRLAPRR
jgi:cytoskeletal protein RodZ